MSDVQLDALLHFVQKEREDRGTRVSTQYYRPIASSIPPIANSYRQMAPLYQPMAPSYQPGAQVFGAVFNTGIPDTTHSEYTTGLSFSEAILRPPDLMLSNIDDPMFDPSSLARFELMPHQPANNNRVIMNNNDSINQFLSIDSDTMGACALIEESNFNPRNTDVFREAAAQGRKSNSTVETPCECSICLTTLGTLFLRGKQACFEDGEEWSVDVSCHACIPLLPYCIYLIA
jgi:hypothetical protein